MPAYFDTGFSVRQPMWHGEGIVLDEYPTDWNEARRFAGLEWEPEIRAMYHKVDTITDDGVTSEFVAVPDYRVVVRPDREQVLGPVTDTFGLVTHAAMGDIVEAIVGQGAKFETAGSCKDGAQVWALAYLDEPYTLPGDDTEHLPFVAMLNSHDGTGACKVVNTQVRVVCWNTYNAASMEGERTGRQFVFRHTAKVMDRIEEAKQALAGLRTDHVEWMALAEQLFGLPADDKALSHFLSEFIPAPEADVISPRVRSNIDAARDVFRSLYLDSPTVSEAHRGTALGLVHASVEYLDHVRGFRNQDTYLGRTMLKPEPLKAKAVNIARRVCAPA
jgi:phage/plasmid-like protein (TIGR03299 family)